MYDVCRKFAHCFVQAEHSLDALSQELFLHFAKLPFQFVPPLPPPKKKEKTMSEKKA